VNAEEKRDGQMFVVDAVLHADLAGPCASDCLSDTVSYAEAAAIIRSTMLTGKDNLIERVAGRIAYALLEKYPMISSVDIAVKKPEAPMPVELEYAGVEISRRRENA
jgi:7,8-dihydroneopterin aldolase/epimerase/oxygenase